MIMKKVKFKTNMSTIMLIQMRCIKLRFKKILKQFLCDEIFLEVFLVKIIFM